MNSFPSDLRFVHQWRTYQQRVLEELQDHLGDNHLHVVAAPGAGKTVLGLEVVRRLNKKTLVLAPTLTIRNQWIHHFATVFSSKQTIEPNFVSPSLTEPAFLNVSTYQSLHAAKKNRTQGISDLLDFETLVLDEAHHLRNEWWKVLVELKEQLDEVKVIALTATPPYDVPPQEWNRYFEMCGPIDSIISIPELVKEGNLCPHEDFIYFSEPTPQEKEKIRQFERQRKELKGWLLASTEFSRALLGHPWVSNFRAEAHEENIFSDPETFISIIIFLNHLGHDCYAQKEFLGLTEQPLPTASDKWFERILSAMISDESQLFDITPEFRRELRQRLSVMHALERRTVTLIDHKDIDKSLRHSESKIDSILLIFRLEQKNLGKDLRMVILTDYIRKEFLSPSAEGQSSRRLGAVPVFEMIRAEYGQEVPLALLTGSLIIVPKSRLEQFLLALREQNNNASRPRTIPLLSDPEYVQINLVQNTRQLAVGAVTAMFNAGYIHTIIGTVALLGEGWDAPVTNTLIMASASSSYVQTNQVRGRAIRVDPNNPTKISSVWHLACIDGTSTGAGTDFQKLSNRFSAFEGLSYKGNQILSGFDRLFPIPQSWDSDQIAALNSATCALATDRQKIAEGWQAALLPSAKAQVTGLVEELQASTRSILELDIVKHPIHRSFVPAAGIGSYVLASIWASVSGAISLNQVALYGTPIVAILLLASRTPQLTRDWWQVYKLGIGPVTLGRIAEVLLEALAETGMLDTPQSALHLAYEPISNERSACALKGGSLYDSDLFIRCMEEILDPVDNPRYLIFRPHPSSKKAAAGIGDYHAVPNVLGTKEHASIFHEKWQARLGACELVYTRRSEGRKILLKARARAWAKLDGKLTNRQSVWK